MTVQSGAGVCLLPDPVQPFEESVYEQSQIFTLVEGSNLCLLDWVSAGRTARGENWDLASWSGRNEIWAAGTEDRKARLLLRDNILLEGDTPQAQEKALRKKMHNLGIFGTLVLRGPQVQTLAAFFLAEFSKLPRIGGRDFRSQEKRERDGKLSVSQLESWRTARLKQEEEGGVLWSAAKVRGCIVVKFGARTVEEGRVWIGSMIKQEGSIVQIFGEDAIMCVR